MMDPENIANIQTYSGCVDQRSAGSKRRHGAVEL
jgi:hypothetical protein